jgi:selenophosphate synthase
VLGKLARQHDPNVLVGFDHADDAGVYQIAPDTALVQTVDFFTPIVDDPFTFGQIAATNSLSDIYAMGGRPLTALALVCFPEKADLEILERILAGGLSKMIEAECTIIGGHSIRDDETKFGYSVTGVVHPGRVLKNGGAQSGDRLLLTKAIGTGVISTAIKKGVAKQSWIDAAVTSMTTLNKTAAEVITTNPVGMVVQAGSAEQSSATKLELDFTRAGQDTEDKIRVPHSSAFSAEGGEVDFASDQRRRTNDDFTHTNDTSPLHAMTDITGFGLLGHVREMLLASDNVSAKLDSRRIPLLEGALECVRAGHIPGGLKANREFAECVVQYTEAISEEMKTMLFDPQTAGGLLLSVAPEGAAELLHALISAGIAAAEIGEVVPKADHLIAVTG